MKRFFILGIASVSLLALTACGSPYDDDIDEVMKLENENLDKPSTETDIDTLERDDTQIKVYEDGEYIELEYVIRGDREMNDPLYKYNDEKDQYESYRDGDFYSDEVDDLEADYTENVDDDS